jgi:peptide deformylase
MAKLKIELLGSEVLRRRAAEIDAPDEALDRLIDDMFETMYHAEGIGLAGPQVGVSRRVIVVHVRDDGGEPFALLNPVVVEQGTALEKEEEGCLSIPGVGGVVTRPAEIVVEGLDRAGNPVRMEAAGMLARCIQHEIDHLDGVLFIDRLSPLKRAMVLKKWRKLTA